MQEKKLDGKVVVITGATGGIGKVAAQVFAGQGAKVVLVARQVAPLEMLEDALLTMGGDVVAVPADITQNEDVVALRREVQENYGAVDVLVNNAAIATLKPLVEMGAAEWQAMTEVNLYAMYQLSQMFLPEMIEKRSGMIINMAAAIARNGYPNLAVYSATKAAVIAFSEAVAKEVRRYGVSVYAICPHGVDTSLYHNLFGQADADKLLAPERVALEIVKVACGESGLKSGQTLDISL